MKPFRNPYRYQGGWAWVAPAITAAAGLLQQRRAKKAAVSPLEEAKQSVLGRVEGAKVAGLHPLAALGTPSSSGTPMQMTDFSAVGDQVQSAVNSYTQQRQWKQEREFQQAQERNARSAQMNAEMREQARLNTDMAMAKKQMDFIDEQIRASQEESLRRSLASTKPVSIPVPGAVRASAEKPPKMMTQYIDVIDRFGKVISIPNPEIYDLEIPSVIGAGTLAIPEVKQVGNGVIQDIQNSSIQWKGWKGLKESVGRRWFNSQPSR